MKKPTDQELEITISKMLRLGIILSAFVVGVGAALQLRNTSLAVPNFTHFHAESASLSSVSGVTQSAFHLNPSGVMQFGLLLLIATPVARVLFCVIGFSRQRDALYITVSSIVLMILIYSLVRGSL